MPEKFRNYFETDDLENLVEEIVFEELHKAANRTDPGFCTCTQCIIDIAAVVLNRVPPEYSSNPVDRRYPSDKFTEEHERRRKMVMAVLPEAISKVTSSSHH